MMSMKPIATTMLVSDVPVVARNVQNVPSWFLDGPVLESRSNEIPTSLKKEDRVWTVQCRCWDMRLNRRYGSESLNTTAISAWFRQHFLFPHFQKKMFMSSCNLHIHWSVLKKGKPIIMWCSKPATWTRDSLSDPSFFLSFSHCAICCWTLTEYHMNIRDAMCELCGKSYPNDRALRKHLKTHAIQREHVCPDCGKDFLTSTKLNEHRRVHTGAKPFQVYAHH